MDIIHDLEIETTPVKAFDALTTDGGIAAWWTKARTQSKVGSINEFDFGAMTATFRVEKLERGRMVGWSAVEVPPDWKGTRVLFELNKTERASVALRFSHTGFKALTPLVASSSYAWAQYLRSLKLYLEIGKGEPFGSAASIAAGSTPRVSGLSVVARL